VVVEITPLDPATTHEEDLRAYHDMRVAAIAVDYPEERKLTFEGSVRRLTTPLTAYGPCQFWAGRWDGRLVALAVLGLPTEENTSLGIVEIQVHPEYRQRGIGTDLLRTVVRGVREAGRPVVFSGGVPDPGTGWPWAAKLGFKEVQRIVMQSLRVETANRSHWDTAMPAGYRVGRWVGNAPEEIVASYARARQAIQDAPGGDMSFEQPDWTVERVRSAEENHRRRNIEQWVVVAIHEESGEVAGLTEVELRTGSNAAMQMDTVVLREHRGHRLGVAVKAEMLRWLLTERPNVMQMNTTTDAHNTHMIDVNTTLGYAVTVAMVNVEADAAALATRLGI
jgi:mycothiol synthase